MADVSASAPAATALGPILNDLIHGPCRQKRPALALVTELGTLFATRRILATLRRAGGRISARWNRRVTGAAIQPALKLRDPLILARNPRSQRLNLSVHPQKHLNDRLTPSVKDRFRLNPLHTKTFDTTPPSPPNQLNAYADVTISR
jgi:hypothetical protein